MSLIRLAPWLSNYTGKPACNALGYHGLSVSNAPKHGLSTAKRRLMWHITPRPLGHLFSSPFNHSQHHARRGVATSIAFHARSSATGPVKDSPPKVRRTVPRLPPRAIKSIFGGKLDSVDGNDLLNELQQKRNAGTLDDPIAYDQNIIDAGLRFLRARYIVDEEAAIIKRVDADIISELTLPHMGDGNKGQSVSQLEKMRDFNKARNERDARRRERQAKALAKQKGGQLVARPNSVMSLVQYSRRNVGSFLFKWAQPYREGAEDREMPKLSSTSRLLPSGLFTLSVVSLSLMFGYFYDAGAASSRLFPDIPPAVATVSALIAINLAVYIAWNLPQCWRFLNRYFIVVPVRPIPSSMLLAEFSQQSLRHLLVNMLALWFVGTRLHDDIGRGPFLALTFSSAVLCSYSFLTTYILRGNLRSMTLGSSGIVWAMTATMFTLYEGRRLGFPFLHEDYTIAWNTGVFLAAFFIYELFCLRRKGLADAASVATRGYAVDYVAHLTGMVVGFLSGLYIRATQSRWRDMKRDSFWSRWWKRYRDGEFLFETRNSRETNQAHNAQASGRSARAQKDHGV